MPNGEFVTARLPAHLADRHFGASLRSYLLYQHHHCQVTQPLLLKQLREWGIEISSGTIDALLRALASLCDTLARDNSAPRDRNHKSCMEIGRLPTPEASSERDPFSGSIPKPMGARRESLSLAEAAEFLHVHQDTCASLQSGPDSGLQDRSCMGLSSRTP